MVGGTDHDKLIWKSAKIGACSSKEAYRYLITQSSQQHLPQTGSRSLTTDAQHLLNRIRIDKAIQPKLKTFMWRLMRRALATGARASRFSTKIAKQCKYCNQTETDMHLFFSCNFSRAVWFTANPSLLTHNLPEEPDGVQDTLTHILTPTLSQSTFHLFITILWYIWKARNDKCFNDKQWSITYLHSQAQADNNVHLTLTPTAISLNTQFTQRTPPIGNTTQHNNNTSPDTVTATCCYTDASIPSQPLIIGTTPIGLGVIFQGILPAGHRKLCIKAQVRLQAEVLQAELMAANLAVQVAALLWIHNCNLATDSQILAQWLNRSQPTQNPIDWRLNPIISATKKIGTNLSFIYRHIRRQFNHTAHSLAKQSRQSMTTRCKL